MDEPVSVENNDRFSVETLMFAAINVETVSVDVKNPVLPDIVDRANVEVVMDEPVSVENNDRFNVETLMFAAINVETVKVDAINPVLPRNVEAFAMVVEIVEPVSVLNNTLPAMVETVSVEIFAVFAPSVDPRSVEKLMNWTLEVETLATFADSVENETVEADNVLRETKLLTVSVLFNVLE